MYMFYINYMYILNLNYIYTCIYFYICIYHLNPEAIDILYMKHIYTV